jgi:hypothetical protein
MGGSTVTGIKKSTYVETEVECGYDECALEVHRHLYKAPRNELTRLSLEATVEGTDRPWSEIDPKPCFAMDFEDDSGNAARLEVEVMNPAQAVHIAERLVWWAVNHRAPCHRYNPDTGTRTCAQDSPNACDTCRREDARNRLGYSADATIHVAGAWKARRIVHD